MPISGKVLDGALTSGRYRGLVAMLRLLTVIAVIWTVRSGAVAQPIPAGVPRTCAVTRGAYCIERSGLIIRVERGRANGSRLTVFEEGWRELPLIIEEPGSCRRTLSDTVELTSMSEDETYLRFTLKLARSGRCNLMITVPNERTDRAGGAVFTALGQIRACARRPCEGPIVGADIRDRFGWPLPQ